MKGQALTLVIMTGCKGSTNSRQEVLFDTTFRNLSNLNQKSYKVELQLIILKICINYAVILEN